MNDLLITSLGFYLFSFAFLGKRRVSMALFLSGSLLDLSAILYNWRLSGSPPLGNLPQVMMVLSACFLPLYLVIIMRKKMYRLAGYFTFAAALPVIVAVFMERNEGWRLSPALRSVWFIPHVISYMLSYAAATIAFLLSAAAFFNKRLQRLPEADECDKVSCHILRFAFPLMTFGLFSGALWADQIWAGYWSWDPKETWSLITWLLYVIYFRCKMTLPPRKYTGVAHVCAFLALLTTFLLVNLMPKLHSPLHSYR
ncbi:MAG: cytochrome c biogenesis protein CcsA [Elusimicrobia bacterium]|nr:cytochrome c biogenesis protein CcsA [Elusimicrobiota bacterium]